MTNKSSLEQLHLEQSWLDATRTTLKVRPVEDYLQLAFAENANPIDSIEVIRQFTLLVEKGSALNRIRPGRFYQFVVFFTCLFNVFPGTIGSHKQHFRIVIRIIMH